MTYQREFERRIRLGVVGVGSHSYRSILPAMTFLPVEIRAICDINRELAEKTASQYGGCAFYTRTKDMYAAEDLEAVVICVSAGLHPELCCEAFDAGLHVWVEKPVAVRASDIETMIARRKDRVAVAGFKKVFMPATDKAIELANDPNYGNLRTLLAVYPMDLPRNGREVLETRQFTNWLGNGVHPLSFMLAVGGPVHSVRAIRGRDKGGLCVLEFKNGVLGNFHLATGPHPIEKYMLYSDKWHLTIDNGSQVELQRGIPFEYGKTTSFVPPDDKSGAVVWKPQQCLATLENQMLFIQGFYQELKYFCDCILEGTVSVKGSLEFARDLMNVYEAALLSEGELVTL